MSIDWERGYSARYMLCEVNPDSWGDGEQVGRVASIDVKRDITGDAPLIETATVHVVMDDPEAFAPGWYRIEAVCVQDGDAEMAALFTGLFEESGWERDKGAYDVELAGRSVLQPAADVRMPAGSWTGQGDDGAAAAAEYVGRDTPAPVDSPEDGFAVGSTVVHDVGASDLEAAWAVLDAAGWQMQTDGSGRVTIGARPETADIELADDDVMLLDSARKRTRDVSSVPNRYIAVMDKQTATAVNDDAASEVSHAVRGRWVDQVDGSPQPRDGETLQAYADRRLMELSTVKTQLSYTRKYVPGVEVGDMVELPDDMGRIVSQSYSCGAGIMVDETVEIEEALWDGE